MENRHYNRVADGLYVPQIVEFAATGTADSAAPEAGEIADGLDRFF
jgi:hypothetical protein